MRKSELINFLEEFDGDYEVTISDKNGTFYDVNDIEFQVWHDRDNEKHASITIIAGGYDNNKTKLIDDDKYILEIDLGEDNEDEKFIDNTNANLGGNYKIDKEEALKAKESFDLDIKEMQNRYKEWYKNKYDEIARQAMMELFEDEQPLDNKTIGDLKFYIYKNGWQDEIATEDLNNRPEVLRLLYHKLDEMVKDNMSANLDEIWGDINLSGKKVERKPKNEKKNTKLGEIFEWMDEWNKKLNQDIVNNDYFSKLFL